MLYLEECIIKTSVIELCVIHHDLESDSAVSVRSVVDSEILG